MKKISVILFIFPYYFLQAQTFSVLPSNEMVRDTSLVRFVSKLQDAVASKDTSFLLKSLDEKSFVSFDGEFIKSDFIGMWDLENSESNLWPYISKLISLGGVFLEPIDADLEFVFP